MKFTDAFVLLVVILVAATAANLIALKVLSVELEKSVSGSSLGGLLGAFGKKP